MTYSQPVEVTGDPTFEFSLGPQDSQSTTTAGYSSSLSSGSKVVFTYEVQETDEDLDGIWIGTGVLISLDEDDSIWSRLRPDSSRRASILSLSRRRVGLQEDHRIYTGPLIGSVSISSSPTPASSPYTLDDVIVVLVEFSQDVTVTGDPHLEFTLGDDGNATTVRALYSATDSNTDALAFAYTVLSTDLDEDGVFIGADALMLDTDDAIRNATTTKDALLEHAEVGELSDHAVDGSPALASVEVTSTAEGATGTYYADEVIEFTVTFTQPVTVTGDPQLDFTLGTNTREAVYDTGLSSGAEVVFTYTVVAADSDPDGIETGADAVMLDTDDAIRNASGVDAKLAHEALGPQSDHGVDGSTRLPNRLPTGLPTITGFTGTPKYGQTLSADTSAIDDDPDGVTGAVFSYQWQRLDPPFTEYVDINGATGEMYTLGADDVGSYIGVVVTYTDDRGYENRVESLGAGPVDHIYGESITLVSNLDEEGLGSTFVPRYQGFRTGSNPAGYELESVELDIMSIETTTALVVSIVRIPPGQVIDTGTPVTPVATLFNPTSITAGQPNTFTAPEGTHLKAGFTYGLSLRASGGILEFKVTFSDAENESATGWNIGNTGRLVDGSLWQDSGASVQFKATGSYVGPAENNEAEGLPTISGTVAVGEHLTAEVSAITDTDGLTFPTYTYQWFRVDSVAHETEIEGATSRRYMVTEDDIGNTIKVRVSFIDDRGNQETLSSLATETVSGPTLPLSLDVIAGDDVVNIAEKAGGFAITGDTGSVGGASVTVTIGSGTLTATSAPSGAWTVAVPADASYVTGASVDITVNATLTGYNAAVELTSTLAVDLVRPSVQTAEVSGTSLELGYSEGLDGSSTPAADAFTVVKTDSSSATSTVGLASVDPVQVSGSVVTLTLDTAVPPGDTVTVDYTVPTGMDAMPVRDTAGNAVEALDDHAVANVPGAPASLNVTPGDTQVTLTWTAPGSDGGSAITGYEYRVSADGGTTWSPDDWTNVPTAPTPAPTGVTRPPSP